MPTKRFLITLFVTYILSACMGNAAPTTKAVDQNAEAAAATSQPTQAPELNFTPQLIDALSPPAFTLHSEFPVLERGSSWDNVHVSPGAVIFHDGILHMFYFGSARLENEPPLKSVGYAVSLDGITWQRVSEEPLQFSGEPDYELGSISVSSVLVSDSGAWVMYFTGIPDVTRPIAYFIGRASAPAPTGPWTIDNAPVLLPGNPARWDGRGVSGSVVIKAEEGFIMYFSGHAGDIYTLGPTKIGLATSPNGITWTKYDDPETTGRLYEDSDPVFSLGADGAWDAAGVFGSQILRTTQNWVMLYQGSQGEMGARITQVGFATSADGIVWERFEGNPILIPEEIMPGFSFGSMVWFYYENKQFLYFGAYHQTFHTAEIYLATSE